MTTHILSSARGPKLDIFPGFLFLYNNSAFSNFDYFTLLCMEDYRRVISLRQFQLYYKSTLKVSLGLLFVGSVTINLNILLSSVLYMQPRIMENWQLER